MHTSRRLVRLLIIAGGCFAASAHASVYGGPGPAGGAGIVGDIVVPQADLRSVVITILTTAMSLLGLAALVTIVLAGIYMVVGLGSDESRDKAKKIIQYTLIGLVIVLFSEVIVNLVTVYLFQQI